ncbi:uncharacterized protein LOC107271221 [Cephus cinctus]|uniref:Uncharacterized protein LOC107271221 n=1 Tax=Cephus cinctus TaxID=211228 RepID=A0AAJ7RPB3_CEPCN|nr:uncharacterized protein LOC107271221 [Cephus cinctus]XP_015602426.1 uncharacterized protein LOC107271221 [Cephus cinctus]XP_015602427.1 uncharacterized protein LOC107271221 [Cephus cinctus]XP_024944234.1 uncharacterized protein LOC107271221 [Cephus cinctus]XP_024944235.1 uncharacterized protein LOC107271221 [Cephus cinctus]XP_024944236.1 uncharacterized protein LOC107271221 [Cephus cinctus]
MQEMDSPPSCSLSATGPLSDLGSSGLGGSISSDSVRAHLAIEMQESDVESKSLSQDSFDYSDGMCGENFNTLKKGPGWNDVDSKLEVEVVDVAIKPPPEFQDSPSPPDSVSSAAPIVCYTQLVCKKLPRWLDNIAENLVHLIIEEALAISCRISWPEGRIAPAIHSATVLTCNAHNSKLVWTSEFMGASALCQGSATITITPYNTLNRPNSRCSLASSRLSSSHNSINTTGLSHKVDDSSFITSAMSHDVLTTSEISDMYNVPFDSDIYTVPIDVVRPLHELRTPQRPKRHRHHRKRRRNVSASSQSELEAHIQQARHYCGKPRAITHVIKSQRLLAEVCCNEAGNGKRHSVPGTSGRHSGRSSNSHTHNIGEPIHMTLHEVRQYLQTLYSSSSDSSENKIKRDKLPAGQTPVHLATPKGISVNNNNRYSNPHTDSSTDTPISNKSSNGLIHNNNNNGNVRKHKKNAFVSIKHKKAKDEQHNKEKVENEREKIKKTQRNFSLNLKQTLCNIFRFRRLGSPDHFVGKRNSIVQGEIVEEEEGVDSDQHANNNNTTSEVDSSVQKLPFFKRALPPLPKNNGQVGIEQAEVALTAILAKPDSPTSIQRMPVLPAREEEETAEDTSMDFAASIEKVKDYGWYWGPISGEAAEKILSNEPDGSFIVRDSSDDHYIFSLSFRLNSCVRHVRIEHDQGNFSFGSCTKFKSHTIVDFIENAVEHSRSGRYLFFLHRRPVLGPMRVQLLHPVSRFKQVQSLQHTCRFVILKMVRRDLIPTLPLPRRLIDYLSTPHYYSEQVAEQDDRAESPVSSSTGELEKICFTPQGLS